VEAIRSASNPLLKRIRAARRGREAGMLLLEGARLCEEALVQGLVPQAMLVNERRPERARALEQRGVEARLVDERLLAALSSLDSPPEVLGLFAAPRARALDELPDAPDALVVVAAGLQDPGNLGALARSAEAAGASALVVLSGGGSRGCRPWNEKALRGSMGSLLRLPVFEPDAAELRELLRRRGFRQAIARTRGGRAPDAFDWSGRVALWITGETGEDPGALAAEGVTIPMASGVESLNVTVAASVLLFAAGRVRGAR
jgi:TrmH family RNA methyltransferase